MRGDARERFAIAIRRPPGEARQGGRKIRRVLTAAARDLEHRPVRRQDPAQDGEYRIAVARHRGGKLRDFGETTRHRAALYQSRGRNPPPAAVDRKDRVLLEISSTTDSES